MDEFYDTTDKIYMLTHELLGTNLDPENTSFMLFKPDIVKFVRNVEPYTYNNELNVEHIKTLTTNFQKNKLVIGGFVTIEFDDGSICLFDGHHRIEALKKLDDATLKQITIYIFHFKSDARESKHTRHLFSQINTVKPFDPKEFERMDNINYIVEQLKKKHPGFKTCLRDNKHRVQKGSYLQSEFVTELRQKLKYFDSINKQYDNNIIIEQIINYNNSLPAKGLNYIFGKQNILDADSEEYKKMQTKQFYLASPGGKKWIDFI